MSNYLAYFISLVTAFLTLYATSHFVTSLQLGGYKIYKCIDKNNGKLLRFTASLLLVTAIFLTLSLLLYFTYKNLIFISNLIEILVFILILAINKNNFKKTPLVFTNRIKRLYVLLLLLTIAFFVATDVFLPAEINLVICSSFPTFSIAFTCISFLLICPFEYLNNLRYEYLTRRKFDKCKAIKIAITGSYAKTSVKVILKTLLEKNFNVVATDKNYNTPLGLAISSKNLKEDTEVFICEMGARKKGDVKRLAKIFNPDIAVITGICRQHLETFKSIENIIKTKSEIYENFTEKNSVFFAGDNPYVYSMYLDCRAKKFITGKKDTIICKNVKTFSNRTEFSLVINNREEKCVTKLLGEKVVENIMLASLVANKLGLTLKEIKDGIERLEYIPHRLELIEGKITLLDDSYNANELGVENSLNVLSLFDKEKNALVSGLVEQGENEELANNKFGNKLAKVCDNVILINTKQAEYVKRGVLEVNENAKIYVYGSVVEAFNELYKVVKEDSVLLITADLPDNYSK